MAFITQQYVAITGDTLTAAIWNDEFQNIITNFNGGITNANIDNAAGIAYSKLDLAGAILDSDLAGSIAKEKITNTAVTESDTQTLTNKTLDKPTVNASVHPINVVAYSGSLVYDMDVANHHKTTLAGNPTITFNNVDSGQAFIIHLEQDGSGNHTVVWPTVRWAGGTTPTLTTAGTKIDTFGFIYDGTDYYGYVIGLNI